MVKIYIELEDVEAKRLMSSVGIKKVSGNLDVEHNPCDKVLLKIAAQIQRELFNPDGSVKTERN